jgi:dipeptidyl aminopeptidase/acylaminoacyl peptidase
MNELNAFERRLAAGLDAYAGPRRSVDADAIARFAASRLPLRRSILLRLPAVVAPAPPFAWGAIAVIALLVLALAAGALLTGGAQPRLPAVVGPAGNGLIAYASGGDIFVGDPLTGRTTAIVSGPENDVRPVFSPDGSRIAFIRLEPATTGQDFREPVAVVVVRPDGTDRRVITPDGFGRFFDFLAWTPDGTGIVLNYEHGLAILDAEGVAELQNLSPPLRKWPGAGYFNANDQVAAMFRPPTGDRILSYEGSTITERDAAGTRLRQLLGPERTDARFVSVWPAWSPDGSKIAFAGDQVDLSDGRGVFVMNADGSDVRLVGREGGGQAWSPDGSHIAFERYSTTGAGPEPDQEAVIVIVDVQSGAERVLETTRNGRQGQVTPPIGYFYWGWSWAPDGRHLLVLARQGSSLMTVDIATGLAGELPWEADSPGSWQRVAATGSR